MHSAINTVQAKKELLHSDSYHYLREDRKEKIHMSKSTGLLSELKAKTKQIFTHKSTVFHSTPDENH